MKFNPCELQELDSILRPLIEDPNIQKMSEFMQHGDTSCLRHSVAVACWSYYLAKKFRVKCHIPSLVRGAMLHDFFLYNWHTQKKTKHSGVHGFSHPKIALKNALKHFELNPIECDVIVKHMWPITLIFPKFSESWLVVAADKICAILESFAITKGFAYRITNPVYAIK